MTAGHREAQRLMQRLGRELGFETRIAYSRDWPTDGVWLLASSFGPMEQLPLVAVEVIVSEGKKSISGSIAVLEHVSPVLGVVLVQDEEVRRAVLRSSRSPEKTEQKVEALLATVEQAAKRSRQRIEVWTMATLRAHLEYHSDVVAGLQVAKGDEQNTW